jgi:hypothetical protein
LTGDLENGGFDGFEDLEIASAAAEIAGESFADLIARGMRVFVEQSFRGDENPRCAVATLGGAEIGKSFLQRMERTVRAEAFYRLDVFCVAFDG